jgi:DNA polymerase-1
VEPFNPSSYKDVLAYLYFKGYKVYKDRKTKKPTTKSEYLERTQRLELVGRGREPDPLIDLIMEAREWGKAVGYLKDTALGADGMFHPIYTFRPETGRLSSVRPNIQNQPNHGVKEEIAKAIRACVIPSKGRILLEVDWQAMEAVLTGYFADDPDYIKISLVDSHTHLCQYILHDQGKIDKVVGPNEEGFKEWLHHVKTAFPDERFEAKRVNLATGYGMQWKHLSEALRCSAKQAKKYLMLKDQMSPKVAKWKENTWREAHSKGYLETPFGYRNYYWNVLKPLKNKPGSFMPGKEANEALAFRPQSSGAAMLREIMLDLDKYDGKLFWWLAPIHDAVLVEVEPKLAREAFDVISGSMAREWSQLGGLAIPVDAQQGERWSEMEEVSW